MYTKIRKINEGFTIVETLIVLAIAALILTIILIAVPDLQRSAKNTNITHDAQNIVSGVQTFEGNNEGQVPNNAVNTAGVLAISGPASAPATTTVHIQSGDTITIHANGFTTPAAASSLVSTIEFDHAADCPNPDASGPGGTLSSATDTRAVAIFYEIQTSSTQYVWHCNQG